MAEVLIVDNFSIFGKGTIGTNVTLQSSHVSGDVFSVASGSVLSNADV